MRTRSRRPAGNRSPLHAAMRLAAAVSLLWASAPGGLAAPGFAGPAPATADGGDFSLDFVASAPFTYSHATGGGAFNDRTIGKSADVVESLEGGDFACGDIVTYLTQIVVDDLSVGKNPHSNETIELDYLFGAEATNEASVGHIDVIGAGINYGAVVNGAGPGGTDSGISDDGGSAATITHEAFTSGATPNGSYPNPQEDNLELSVQIDDLESFETVVLRIDVLLGCGGQGTGNIQAKLDDADVVAADGQPFDDAIPGGAQTIPFKSFSSERAEAPVITVVKDNDADEDGTFTDTEQVSGTVPTVVTYRVTISNNGPDPATIDAVADDTHDIAGSSCAVLVGTTIAAGETITCTFDAAFDVDNQTVTNIFSASASNEGGSSADEDDSTVIVPDLLPAITLSKSPTPGSVSETGGNVTFTVTVTNQSSEDVTLDSLVDDVFGDLDGAGSCSVPQALGANGGQYSCSFTELLAGEPGAPHVNTATATASDDDGNEATADDDATVTFTDVLPEIDITKTGSLATVPETGGDVTFTVTVTNQSGEDLTLGSLVDDVFGDLDGAGSCSVPQTLGANGGQYSCSFTEFLAGEPGAPHVNTATATASDDDGNEATASDDETVSFGDEIPAISVTKTASVSSVPETGGDVTFTVTVTNQSAEPLTLDSLVDDVFGDLDGAGSCSVPQALGANGGQYSCSFTEALVGQPAAPHMNTVTGVASDDDGNEATDSDSETVGFADLLPAITVDKVSSTIAVPETGGNVTFTVTVTNQSSEDVTLDSLVDDVFGDLDGAGSCSVPQTLGANGGQYSCSFTEFLAGDPAVPHVNTVTATASDDDENQATDSDDETVSFGDEIPGIRVDKSASESSVLETGASVTFKVVVDNIGQTDVVIQSLVDDVFGDLDGRGSCTVPQAIPVGSSYTCTFTETVSGAAGQPHVDVVTASGVDETGDEVSASDDALVDLDPVIDLEVNKSADPVLVFEGSQTTFTISATNRGPSPATGVVLGDVPAAELQYVSHSGDGTFDPATWTWTVGGLAVGETKSLAVTVAVTDAGSFLNIAEVTAADQPDSDSVPADGTGDDYAEATVDALAVLASGQIGDTVFSDSDADGVQDSDEDGISGVSAELENLDTGDKVTQTTNADGKYLFAALEGGRYRVTITKPASDLGFTTADEFVIDLAEGQVFLDADFGLADALPVTGMEIQSVLWAGALMLLLGVALAAAGRPRRRLAE